MKKLIIFILFFLVSCKVVEEEGIVKNYQIDTKAQSLVDTFYARAESKGIKLDRNLELFFSNNDAQFNSNIVGYCSRYKNNRYPPRVVLRASFWNQANYTERYLLIFHELGHCLLDRGHKEATVRVGIHYHPISIMYPSISSVGSYNYSFYIGNSSLYEDELFNRNLGYLFSSLGTITGDYALRTEKDTNEFDENVNDDEDNHNNLNDVVVYNMRIDGRCDE